MDRKTYGPLTQDSFNWEKFEHAIIVDAGKEEVFACVSSAAGLERWFLGEVEFLSGFEKVDKSKEPLPGNDYKWHWLQKDFSSKGKVLAVEQAKSIEYSFGSIFRVKFIVESFKGRSKLRLIQTVETNGPNMPFAYLNCCVCWVFFMTNLKSVVENDIDLREREVADEVLVNL